MASQNEIHSSYVPSNGKLPHEKTSGSLWQPTSHATMLSGDARVQSSDRRGGASEAIKHKGEIAITESGGEKSICN